MTKLIGPGVVGAAFVAWWMWNEYARAGGVRRGFAAAMDIVENLSPAHARRAALSTRPGKRVTWWTPLREVAILLGKTTTRTRRVIAVTLEEVILVLSGPRTGKTGFLTCKVREAVGAVFVTSTRPDIFLNSIKSRALRPWWVFNPQRIGGIASTLRWSPVLASYDVRHAWLVAAMHVDAEKTGGKDAKFWEDHSVRTLRCLLAAAYVSGKDMRAVHAWAGALGDQGALERPIAALETDAGRTRFPGWAADLRRVSEYDTKPLGSIAQTLATSLGYMGDPTLVEAVTPNERDHFTPTEYIATGGSLYVLGEHETHSPTRALLSTFLGVLAEYARRAAASSDGGRLDPPLTWILDEATSTFRTPLPTWTAYFGGYGMPMIISTQSYAQLVEAFGAEGAATIWETATTKLCFGGIQDVDTLQKLSTLCGTRKAAIGEHEHHDIPVMSPGQIHGLPRFVALVLHRQLRPVLVRVEMAWEQKRPPVAEPLVSQLETSAEVVRLADRMTQAA